MQNMSEPLPEQPIDPGPDGPYYPAELAVAALLVLWMLVMAALPFFGQRVIEVLTCS